MQSNDELNKKAEKMNAIYKAYLVKLEKLQDKQRQLINNFIKKIEKEKIVQIEKSLKE